MPTTIADNVAPERISLEDEGRPVVAMRIGPALHGWVYRSDAAWYRSIPLRGVPIAWRQALQDVPRAGGALIAPTRHWQTLDGSGTLILVYPVEAGATSLLERFDNGSVGARFQTAIAWARAVGRDAKAANLPPVSLPAEIIVRRTDVGWLWIPWAGFPDMASLFACPHRARYLAPEIVRGTAVNPDPILNRYTTGVHLLDCYYRQTRAEAPERALVRAATGTHNGNLTLREDLPNWLNRFPTHARTLALLQRLASVAPQVRARVDLEGLATALEDARRLLDPRLAVARLRDSAQPMEAYELLHEAFPLLTTMGMPEDVHPELLVLGGDLCAHYLHRPLEAIDYYERAKDWESHRGRACQDQFLLIANARNHPALGLAMEEHSQLAVEMDVRIWENYRSLTGPEPVYAHDEVGHTNDVALAEYLLWRGQYAEARDFIYPRLFDAQKRYIWWDFDMTQAYVRSFMGLAVTRWTRDKNAAEAKEFLAQASIQLQQNKDGLQLVRQNQSMEESLVHQYGQEVADLEYSIVQLRQKIDGR